MNESYFSFDKDNNQLLFELTFEEFQDFDSIIDSYKKYKNILLGYDFVDISYNQYKSFYDGLVEKKEYSIISDNDYRMAAYHITQYIMFAKTYIEYCSNYINQMDKSESLITEHQNVLKNFSIKLLNAIRNYTMHLAIPFDNFLILQRKSDKYTVFVFSIFKEELLKDKYLKNHNKAIIAQVDGDVIKFSDYIHVWNDIISDFHTIISTEYISRLPENVKRLSKYYYSNQLLNEETGDEYHFTSLAIVRQGNSGPYIFKTFDFSKSFFEFIARATNWIVDSNHSKNS